MIVDAGANISIWAGAEFNAGLIATSMPPLKPMFESALKHVFGITAGSLNSSARRAYYGARSSLKPSRLTSRHSQHQILPEESQADLALEHMKSEAQKTETEKSSRICSVEERSIAVGQPGRDV